MGHLSLPRIHFQGDFCTNVATANNNNVVEVVDVAKVEIINTQGKSDDDFGWLTQPDPEHGGLIPAGWNYYGDNICSFQNVKVTCIELPGQSITSNTEDPLIGLDVILGQAAMVDLDPEGQLGTQIFCDNFGVQKGESPCFEGASDPCVGGQPTRLYSRWLTFQRNLGVGGFKGASAVWQAAIPTNRLSWNLANSPALEALHNASDEGLVVRFCTYLVAPRFMDSADLVQLYANGEENPAFGRVVGTIGPWHAGELSSVTMGRLLHPSAPLVGDHFPYQLGPAVAQIHRERRVVSVDLITTFPERDETLAKVDVGPVSLRLHYKDEDRDDTFALGPVAYDQKAYEATAGVVDIPYSSEVEPFLDQGQLLLVQDNSGKELLAETDLTIETDDRAIYLQEGETQQVHLQVVEKGQVLQKEVTVNIAVVLQGAASSATQVVEAPDQISVGPNGVASLSVTAKQAGACVIRFVPPGSDVSPFNPTTDFFTSLRILPTDDYDHIPGEQLTFDFLKQEVLRYYCVLYPAMCRIINLDDEDTVRRHARRILSLVSKDKFSEYGYMPRTRELSDGKRKLLMRWCQLQLQKH